MRIETAAYGRARGIALTSLIDVIFLLLLFFMLTATFSRFGDVELTTGGGSGASQPADQMPVFLRLSADGLSLNGEPLTVASLGDRLNELREAGRADAVILSVRDGVTSQQLVDVIAAANAAGGLPLQIVR